MSGTGRGGQFHFENRQREFPIDESRVRDALASLAADLGSGREFSVVVSSDAALREANRCFRDIPESTDVLSFPGGEGDYLGDILISAGLASTQAAERGHSVEQEIHILALHGMLHLKGYDHASDDGEMRREEARLRRSYGLPAGLIERAGG